MVVFFFQAEDGIRDAQESRGLGDVYKRQELMSKKRIGILIVIVFILLVIATIMLRDLQEQRLSLIHI